MVASAQGTVSPLFSPRGEAKCVRGPSVQDARRSVSGSVFLRVQPGPLVSWRTVNLTSLNYFPAQNTRSAGGGDCHQFRAFKESTTYGRIRRRNWLTVPSHPREPGWRAIPNHLRGPVGRLEDRGLPPRPIRVVFEFLDEAGHPEWTESFVVGGPAFESDVDEAS